MINKELVEILACPETKEAVQLADDSLLQRLNGMISEGSLLNRDGDVVVDPLEEALIRADGRVLYPIREGIPIMLIGEGIPLEEIDD